MFETLTKSFPSAILAIVITLGATAGIYVSERKNTEKEIEIRYLQIAERNQKLELRVAKLEAQLNQIERLSEKNDAYINSLETNLRSQMELLKDVLIRGNQK